MFALIFIFGCASKANIEIALDKLQGSSIKSVIALLGEPTTYLKLPSTHKYTWNKQTVINLPSNDWKYDSAGDRYYSPEDNDLKYECTIQIYTSLDFKIQRSIVSGDSAGCSIYSEDLAGLHTNSDFSLLQGLQGGTSVNRSKVNERQCSFICGDGKSYVGSCDEKVIFVGNRQCKKGKKIN